MCDANKWDGVSIPKMIPYRTHWCKNPTDAFGLATEQSAVYEYPDATDKTSSIYVPPPYVADLVTGWGSGKIVTTVPGEKSIGDMYKEPGIHDNSLSKHTLRWKDGVATNGMVVPAWTDFRRRCCSGANDPSVCGAYINGTALCDEVQSHETTDIMLFVFIFILVVLLAVLAFLTFIHKSKPKSSAEVVPDISE